ncbi:hypothetical protein OJAV_G00070860 [Oryzias javanicus]|uniref:Uncharacterized protein n=1 Tax=Oryzias javanicus TaxID=123683 RepID=A0A3S2PDT4_ORYJA|nr:hypothetical protein OJAV_G00070860 [Oryzias javanicus]
MKVSQTLLWVLLLRGSCLLPPHTAAASVLDTTEVYDYDYDYTANYEDVTEKTEQPEPPGVLFYVRVILGIAIAILFIFPIVCLIFLWHKRVSSSGRSSGEHNVC